MFELKHVLSSTKQIELKHVFEFNKNNVGLKNVFELKTIFEFNNRFGLKTIFKLKNKFELEHSF